MAKSLPKKRVGGIKSHFSFYEKIRTYDSHNKNVAQSLESLVFSRTKAFKQSLTKKRLVIASSSLVVLIVLGTYFAPKGAAESAIFYPTSCLGGWMNPSLAQGQPETTSNDDVSQFNPDNSAVLAANTNADIYCGSFTGTFPEKTKPTKILISLSWAQAGNNAVVSHQSDQNIVGESFASSSLDILDSSSTDASNPVTFTATTTSDATDTSSGDSSNTPLDQPSTQTPTEETPTQAPDTTTPATESTPPVDTSSPQGNTGTSDTPAPTSFIDQLVHHITSLLFEKAYAQDATGDTPLAQPVDPAPVNTQTDTQVTTPDVSPSNP